MRVSRASESSGGRGQRRAGGFTLVEMMVTIFIAAVLLAYGVPSFNDAVLSSRTSTIANDLYASMQLARSEAIKRNVNITLCPSTDRSTCDDTGDWDVGWIVRDGATSQVLQVQEAAPDHFKVVQSSGTADLVFQPTFAVAPTGVKCLTVYREDIGIGGPEGRAVHVSGTGSVYVTRVEDSACP